MSILVTGGAGYIGSHMVFDLVDRGEDVVVLDNLSTGTTAVVAKQAHFIEGDVGNVSLVKELLQAFDIGAVIHFAGSVVVPESLSHPLAYYANNTVATHGLIQACVDVCVRNFIFSSSAAVYGLPECNPVSEDSPTLPISPYGRSKLMTEWMLEDAGRAYDFRYVALRYFNVAGADPQGRTGQSTPRATHLIKRACEVALGRRPHLDIFGTDFPTPDGTGVRDYIHVSDLITAHLCALDNLRAGASSLTLNCGYGRGFSVREVIAAVERVSKRRLPVQVASRRPGDPSETIADARRIKGEFGWRPQHDDLDDIVATAYAWESRLDHG